MGGQAAGAIFSNRRVAILVLAPMLLPIVQAAGVSPIRFGIIMAVNLSVGMYFLHPDRICLRPQTALDVPVGTIYRGAMPFAILNFITLLVITYVPEISMILLRL